MGNGYACIYSAYWIIKSLVFYYKNNWDFTIDFGPSVYRSEFRDKPEEVRGKTKHLLFLPTVFVVSSVMLISFAYLAIKDSIHG